MERMIEMKPNITWILIASSQSAKIFENAGPGKGLNQVADRTFQASANIEHSDREGRSFNTGSGARHKLEPHHGEDPVLRDYITSIINSLTKDYTEKRFNRIILCAAPATLGSLRNYLPDNIKTQIIAEISKDLTNIPTHNLSAHFKDFLAV